jgi:hypothetical protein
MRQREDYRADLIRSVETGEYQSTDVPTDEVKRLTRRLRYLAERLYFEIEIHTTPAQRGETMVSFICQRKTRP